jgi:FkbM family methyltransferase
MYHSQFNQDKFVENIFGNHKNGIFVDVGAHDGVSINNTLFFEETHNWTGINIEPIFSVYEKLKENRPNCINVNCAVDIKDGYATFISNRGYTEMISGLKEHYDKRHYERLLREIYIEGGETQEIVVKTRRLESIFDEFKIKHINYLSIDVEGAEGAVIRSINFEKVVIDVIGFENNYQDTSKLIINFLIDKNYRLVHNSGDIFMIRNDFLNPQN